MCVRVVGDYGGACVVRGARGARGEPARPFRSMQFGDTEVLAQRRADHTRFPCSPTERYADEGRTSSALKAVLWCIGSTWPIFLRRSDGGG